MRTTSAPRSGTRINLPVGSTCTSCGCATSCRELGPFLASVNFSCCSRDVPERGALYVVMVEGELDFVRLYLNPLREKRTHYWADAIKPLPSDPP
jgi:hypothetical protein